MKIIGIDPGIRNTGWAIVQLDSAVDCLVDAGVVYTAPDKNGHKLRCQDYVTRLGAIQDGLRRAIEKHEPSLAMVEGITGSKSYSAAVGMALGFASAVLTVREAGLEPFTLLASQVRSMFPNIDSIHGRKTKGYTRDVVRGRFGDIAVDKAMEGITKGRQEHAYDAAGLIIAGLRHPAVEWARRWEMKEDYDANQQANRVREALDLRGRTQSG